MPRPPSSVPKSRLSLELAQRSRDRLERLSEKLALTFTEIILRALDLYEAILTTQREGGVVVVKRRDGTEHRLLIL
jgi:hypothetical protein